MSDTPLGVFCWFDLMTTAPDAAPAFYRAVTGWGTAPFEGGEKPYTMWTNGGTPLGGVMQLPPEAEAAGAPPHWLGYVSTPDVKETAERARELGGTVMMELTVPNVGSIAIIADPQGAVLGAFEPLEAPPGHGGPPKVGEFSWHELATEDPDAAWTFYSGLFGWQKAGEFDMGPGGIYQIYHAGAHPLGGIFRRPPEMPMSAWLYYVRADDLDGALERVGATGGRVLNGPMEVPGGDRVAQCMDDADAAFALHEVAKA